MTCSSIEEGCSSTEERSVPLEEALVPIGTDYSYTEEDSISIDRHATTAEARNIRIKAKSETVRWRAVTTCLICRPTWGDSSP